MVFSFDEKTQYQALDRTQPSLPIKPGRARTMTHDYKRNGTIDLFAALNVATGEVLHETRQRHTADDVLAFFKSVDAHVPKHLDVDVVLDNLSAHSAPPVAKWLEHPRRARWHLHFTPTSSSWLNLIEGWFAQLTNRRLRTGTFDSVTAYERTSLIVTTNLPFESWTEVLGSERLTGAALDRLTHRCRIIETKGESYRLHDAKTRTRSTKHQAGVATPKTPTAD